MSDETLLTELTKVKGIGAPCHGPAWLSAASWQLAGRLGGSPPC